MKEQISWGMTDNLLPIMKKLDCPPESLAMLERVPKTFFSDDECAQGICVRTYDAHEDFETWEHGRIFHKNFELQWEKQDAVFSVVYIGKEKALPIHHTASLSDFEIRDESYYLWGEKMAADTLEKIGQPKATSLFLELQIPRLLHYPVSNQDGKLRVKLSARHYLNAKTGVLEFYRFRFLEEV